MQAINIHEAKTHFSKLIDAAISGKEIIIAKAGKPVVKLIPISKNKVRRFGILKGKIKIANDFDAPLPDDILSSFEEH
ncbi:MAG: type II toxin-antitoxin system Phd/YefM family antitoxin [Rickettsia endosymbiont of Ixodes persulcatus]|nr:type II toxin-antitoxin system Phd/YefM family antitoxin [Rickettsia endosymbiont of Ixodes persulcatus]